MPTWPIGLPQKAAPEQYQELPPFAVGQHEMDAGPPKTFGTGETEARRYSVRLDLTKTQVEILDVFYRFDLRDGELAFDWVEPRSQAPQSFLLMQEPDYAQIAGDIWRASLVMETRAKEKIFGALSRSACRTTVQLAVGATFASVSVSGTLSDASID